MQALFENILVMILTIMLPLTVLYLVLLFIGWGLKIKSGNREQQGLTDLWLANQADAISKTKMDNTISDEDHSADNSS
jgi:Na+/H+ antiporter NhaC